MDKNNINLNDIDWTDESNKRYGNRTISITKDKVFGFNSGFYSDKEIHKHKYVSIGYLKENRVLVFRFIREKDVKNKPDGASTIFHDPKGNSGKASAPATFAKHNINPEAYAGRYPYHEKKDTKYGMLYYIYLDEKIESKK